MNAWKLSWDISYSWIQSCNDCPGDFFLRKSHLRQVNWRLPGCVIHIVHNPKNPTQLKPWMYYELALGMRPIIQMLYPFQKVQRLFLWQYQNKCVNNSKTIPHLLHPPKKMCLHMIFIPSAKTPSKQRHTNNLSF